MKVVIENHRFGNNYECIDCDSFKITEESNIHNSNIKRCLITNKKGHIKEQNLEWQDEIFIKNDDGTLFMADLRMKGNDNE